MRLDPSDIADLRPVIAEAVRQTLEQIEDDRARLGGRIAYPEGEAAGLLGIAKHILRDCRLRGELRGSRVGRRILYSRSELEQFLARQRT